MCIAATSQRVLIATGTSEKSCPAEEVLAMIILILDMQSLQVARRPICVVQEAAVTALVALVMTQKKQLR